MIDDAYEQAYGKAFARVYDQHWSFFASRVAPQLVRFFSDSETMRSQPRSLLDVACGTGQLA